MTESSRGYQQFFAELKRRKVFKVAAVYGATAFVLLQVADLLKEGLNLPATFIPFITAVTLLGFPLALILAWAFEVTPEGVRKTDAAGPGEIESIIAAPAGKRWPAGLMALAGFGALVAGVWFAGQRSATVARDGADAAGPRLVLADLADDPRPSIAVLPFVNMSADQDQVYFSDGMTEEILNVLAKIQDLRVAARTSTFALRDRELTAPQWGDTLGVGYLVEGSVRKSGDMLRITAQLIDTSDGSHLWSDNFDRPLANVFQIQTEIAEKIADALAVPLGLGEGESLTTPTADLEAYDLYLAGRQRMRSRGEGVAEAVTLFEAAIARDSSWAPAWAGLAESRSLVPYYDQVSNDSANLAAHLGAAEAAARRALELDPDNASALVALGSVYRDSWRWKDAEDAYLRALAVDPDNVEAHQQYAEYLDYVGRETEAHRAANRALALDRSPIRLNVAGYIALGAGRTREGIALLQEGIRLDPDCGLFRLRSNVRWGYLELGHWDDWWNNYLVEYRNCRPEFPSEDFDKLLAVWPAPNPPPDDLDVANLPWFGNASKSRIAATLGQQELALEQILESYAEAPPFGSSQSLLDRLYDPVRDDPRFQALLERRGLAGLVPQRLPPEAAP